MYIYIIGLYFILFYNKIRSSNSNNLLSLTFWLFFAYGFLLLTCFFSGISYIYGDNYRIMPYFLLCILLVLIGHRIGREQKYKSKKNSLRLRLNTLGLISVTGSIVYIFDIIRLNKINFGSRIEDLDISVFGTLGNAISGFSLLVWLYSLYYNKIDKIKIPLIAYFSVLSYVAGGVLSAGRQSIFIVIVSSVILILWSNKKNKETQDDNQIIIKKNPVPWKFYIIILLFVNYFLFISKERSRIFDFNDKISGYEMGFSTITSSETLNTAENLGSYSEIYVEMLYYYSHELIRLDLLYENYDYHPLFGLSQMTYLERRLQWLFGNQGDASWNEVENAIERKGRFSAHTWSTFIGNYILDFGRFGALIACFFTGYFAGLMYARFKKNGNSMTVVRQCIICTGIVFSIQFSPISELTYFIPLIFSSYFVLIPANHSEKKIIF